jgi:hypothetical protein
MEPESHYLLDNSKIPMKKIPTRPSKVAGVTILLLAFFI